MRPVLLAVGVLALAACDRPAAPQAGSGADAASGRVPDTNPAASPTASPLGGGSSMAGSVSGLTGLVTAFRVQETATQIIVDLAADVLFAFDSADLSPGAPEQLRKTVEQIGRGGGGDIQVIGHTDSRGSDAYNDDLSLRRARAVATWLSTEGGVPATRLQPEGRGEREPVASEQTAAGADDPQGRALNRRVRVIIPR